MRDIVWKIGGKQGEGIESAGDILSLTLHRLGFYVFAYRHFMSLVKGGHTTFTVRMADERIRHLGDMIDVLVAFDQMTINESLCDMRRGGVVIYDSSLASDVPSHLPVIAVGIPLLNLAKACGGPQVRNMVALGASAAVLGIDPASLEPAIRDRFQAKGKAVVQANVKAVHEGYTFTAGKTPTLRNWQPPRSGADGALLLTGNDAVALGAVTAGCRFLAAYPITPATDIMYRLIDMLPKLGGVVVQAEDEIAAVNMAIGANFAGVRGMTCTSGPGFSLMMEALGLAGMAEIPLVIVDVQRAGPSTGLPTKTEQGDLNEAVYGTHGDIPRIVLAPRTVEECFEWTAQAFNLSERYQCPVIVLSDMFLGTSAETVENLPTAHIKVDRGRLYVEPAETSSTPTAFPRYDASSADGISARSVPGQRGGIHVALGNEHANIGVEIEDPWVRADQVAKRGRKLATFAMPNAVRTGGDQRAPFALIGFGSSYGALSEATSQLLQMQIPVKHIQLGVLEPFPLLPFLEAVHGVDRLLVVEQNASAQLANLIQRHTGLGDRISHCLKFDGTPLRVNDVLQAANRVFPMGVNS